MSTNHLFMWSGSEVVVVELCESLVRRGIEVLVFANHVDEPLRTAITEAGAHLTDVPEDVRLFDYDFAWIQHHTAAVVDLTFDERSCAETLIVFAHLSPFEPLEYPGFVIESAIVDVVVCNSEETRDAVIDARLHGKATYVARNAAPDGFFTAPRAPSTVSLRNVCVVSNHVADEVRDALLVLQTHHGVRSTVFGVSGDRAARITPALLREFDVVISIGKTVQYALASHIPVFCYDHFGGPGYLDDENLARAEYYNFSGRCCRRRLSGDAIADEIVHGFSSAVSWSAQLDVERFRLEGVLDALIASRATPNELKASALAQAREDVVRERRFASAVRTSYRNQRYFEQRAAISQAAIVVRDEELAARNAEIAARDAELAALRADCVEIRHALARHDVALTRVDERVDHAMNLIANRVVKPAALARKLVRTLRGR